MWSETTVEWRVVLFPFDRPMTFKTGSEAQVRAIAAENPEWNPIVESRSRTVTVSDWETQR